jgi:glutaredoxin-like protein NrdH
MTNPFSTPITVLSKPSCVQCTATYRALDNLGVEYEVIDITQNDEAMAWAKENDCMQAPVVAYSGGHFTGFRPDLIKQLAAKLA